MTRRPTTRQNGFTLVELLVVVAIIGILASVAIAQYALYKQRSIDTLIESTLQSGRHAMEAYYVQNISYVGANETTLHDDFGFRRASVTSFNIVDQQQLYFVIRVCAIGGTAPGFEFDSRVGHSLPGTACP